MIRKLCGSVLLCLTITCVMGAVNFDAGQPNPNPGGVAMKLEGKGTYTVPDGESFLEISFNAFDTKNLQSTSKLAKANNNKWDCTLTLVAGNYDAYGKMTTFKKNVIFVETPTVNTDVK